MNQPPTPAESVPARAAWLPPYTFAGFAVAVLALVLISFFSLRAVEARNAAGDRVQRTVEVLDHLAETHHGRVVAESAQDSTSFRAELPRDAREAVTH